MSSMHFSSEGEGVRGPIEQTSRLAQKSSFFPYLDRADLFRSFLVKPKLSVECRSNIGIDLREYEPSLYSHSFMMCINSVVQSLYSLSEVLSLPISIVILMQMSWLCSIQWTSPGQVKFFCTSVFAPIAPMENPSSRLKILNCSPEGKGETPSGWSS